MSRERIELFGPGRGLVGVLAGGDGATGVILLNAGLVHRVGPHRLNVRLARALASKGFPSLRFDFSGVGDSAAAGATGDFTQRSLAELSAAVDVLIARSGATRVCAVGLCTGAALALEAARADARVVGAVLVNWLGPDGANTVVDQESAASAVAGGYLQRLTSWRSWRRLLTGRSRYRLIVASMLGAVWARLRGRPQSRASEQASVDALGEGLRHGARLSLVFATGTTEWTRFRHGAGRLLPAVEWSDRVAIKPVPEADHTFSPVSAQDALIEHTIAFAEGC